MSASCGTRSSGRAKRLGVSHTTIANKLKRHGIGSEG
ncbi:hypothetical protein DU490_15870 [Halomonas sp. DQ26W]|nr:hypothetical protein DU490_15870 [Halomonas sp. DQ26W]